MSEVRADGVADDGGLGFDPADAAGEGVLLQAEEGPQRQLDVVLLGSGLAGLAALDLGFSAGWSSGRRVRRICSCSGGLNTAGLRAGGLPSPGPFILPGPVAWCPPQQIRPGVAPSPPPRISGLLAGDLPPGRPGTYPEEGRRCSRDLPGRLRPRTMGPDRLPWRPPAGLPGAFLSRRRPRPLPVFVFGHGDLATERRDSIPNTARSKVFHAQSVIGISPS